MRAHWLSGLDDIRKTLSRQNWLNMPEGDSGFVARDIHGVDQR